MAMTTYDGDLVNIVFTNDIIWDEYMDVLIDGNMNEIRDDHIPEYQHQSILCFFVVVSTTWA